MLGWRVDLIFTLCGVAQALVTCTYNPQTFQHCTNHEQDYTTGSADSNACKTRCNVMGSTCHAVFYYPIYFNTGPRCYVSTSPCQLANSVGATAYIKDMLCHTTATRTTTSACLVGGTGSCPCGQAVNNRACAAICTPSDCSNRGVPDGFRPDCSCRCSPGYGGPDCSTTLCLSGGKCQHPTGVSGSIACGDMGRGYDAFRSNIWAPNGNQAVKTAAIVFNTNAFCASETSYLQCHSSSTSKRMESTKDIYEFSNLDMSLAGGLSQAAASFSTAFSFSSQTSTSSSIQSQSDVYWSEAQCLKNHVLFQNPSSFNDSTNFNAAFKAKLDQSNTAQDFVDLMRIYGTHVIFGVKNGGKLLVESHAVARSTSQGNSAQSGVDGQISGPVSAAQGVSAFAHGFTVSGGVTSNFGSTQAGSCVKVRSIGGVGSLSQDYAVWEASVKGSGAAPFSYNLMYLKYFVPAHKHTLWDAAMQMYNQSLSAAPAVISNCPAPPQQNPVIGVSGCFPLDAFMSLALMVLSQILGS